MKKSNKVLAFLSTAALTFGLLYATVGDKHFNHCHKHWQKHHCSIAPENSKQSIISE